MNTIHFASSQYVMVEFVLATSMQRLLATAIDMMLFGIYFILCVFFWDGIYNLIDPNYVEIYTFIALLLVRMPWILYQPICEFLFDGQTIGKYIMGIKVVTFNGERLSSKEVFIRWFFNGNFLWIGNSPFGFIMWFVLGFLAIFTISWSSYKQRLADRLANTVVVQVRQNTNYRLENILNIKTQKNHKVNYPQVVHFTEEDMHLVKSVVLRKQNYPNKTIQKLNDELCLKIANFMNIDPSTIEKDNFLQQVLQDYVVLTR